MPRRKAHSSKPPTVVIFRDRIGLRRSRVLFPKACFIESIKIFPRRLRKTSRIFDFGLITSQHAVRSLDKNTAVRQWIVIGDYSARALRDRGLRNIKVLKTKNSNGIRSFFKNRSAVSIFYPRSSLADREMIQFLKGQGRTVWSPIAYETKLCNLKLNLQKLLNKDSSFVFVLFSPSSAKAIFRSGVLRELRHRVHRWIAIGPTTGAVLQSRGLNVIVSKTPDQMKIRRVVSACLAQ